VQEARPETAARKLFAANLWRERKARGLSQRALAQLAGLDRTYVGSVERGERNVSIDNVERPLLLCLFLFLDNLHFLFLGKFNHKRLDYFFLTLSHAVADTFDARRCNITYWQKPDEN